jgi:hypothetical protein
MTKSPDSETWHESGQDRRDLNDRLGAQSESFLGVFHVKKNGKGTAEKEGHKTHPLRDVNTVDLHIQTKYHP